MSDFQLVVGLKSDAAKRIEQHGAKRIELDRQHRGRISEVDAARLAKADAEAKIAAAEARKLAGLDVDGNQLAALRRGATKSAALIEKYEPEVAALNAAVAALDAEAATLLRDNADAIVEERRQQLADAAEEYRKAWLHLATVRDQHRRTEASLRQLLQRVNPDLLRSLGRLDAPDDVDAAARLGPSYAEQIPEPKLVPTPAPRVVPHDDPDEIVRVPARAQIVTVR